MNTQALQQPIRVEMVGRLPTLFSMCANCCTTDTIGARGIDLAADQMRDYPPEVVETNQRAAELYTRLLQEYGGAVIPLVVSTTSLHGKPTHDIIDTYLIAFVAIKLASFVATNSNNISKGCRV